jgi:hypothetical protein
MPEYGRRGKGRVTVLPFPRVAEISGLDWAGRGFAESAELALRLGGLRFGDDGDAVLAGRFWRSLARGGVQAALYAIDCARGDED